MFAAGDVRHGAIKRVASAVGDGSTAIRLIHDYLALAPPYPAEIQDPYLIQSTDGAAGKRKNTVPPQTLLHRAPVHHDQDRPEPPGPRRSAAARKLR